MHLARWLILWTLTASVAFTAELPTVEGALGWMRKGDSTNAIATLSALLKQKPDEVRAWHLRAQIRGLSGDADGAISDFGEAIQRNPKSPYLVQERGMLHFRRNDMEKALIDFDRANEIDSRMAPSTTPDATRTDAGSSNCTRPSIPMTWRMPSGTSCAWHAKRIRRLHAPD